MGKLGDQLMIRMWCYLGHVDFPIAYPYEKKNVISCQVKSGPHIHSEEIRCCKQVPIYPNELFPRSCLFSLGRGCQAALLQDFYDCLIADGIPQVGQDSDSTIITRAYIFFRQAND